MTGLVLSLVTLVLVACASVVDHVTAHYKVRRFAAVGSPLGVAWAAGTMRFVSLPTNRHFVLLAITSGLACQVALGAPLLRCEVSYAGSNQTVQARPTADPYLVPSVDIGGRFWFKAVMVGAGAQLDYIKLYAYLDEGRQPVLVQQSTYLPPFRVTQMPYALTGEQRLYAGPVERELHYSCTLQGVAP